MPESSIVLLFDLVLARYRIYSLCGHASCVMARCGPLPSCQVSKILSITYSSRRIVWGLCIPHVRKFHQSSSSRASNTMSIVVTKNNFDRLLPHIVEDIRRSAFVAMDTEFTGLRTAPEFATLPVDSHDVRYSRMRKSVSQTGLVQIGLVPFIYDPETNSFVHRAYSFYLTELQKFAVMDPANTGKVLERMFAASSCHFLRENKFDFNEYYDGAISYMSRRSEEALRMNLLQESFDNVANFVGVSEQGPRSENPSIFLENERAELFPLYGENTFSYSVDEANIMYVRSARDTVWFRQMQQGVLNWVGLAKQWIENPETVPVKVLPISAISEHDSISHYAEPNPKLVLLDFKDQETGNSVLVPHFRMPLLSRWRRKVTMTLLEQSLEGSKLKDDIYFMSQGDASDGASDSALKSVHVFWLQNVPGGRAYLNKIYFRNEMERISKAIDRAIGFRKVIDAITDNKVPLIGHHCLYDLMHLVDKFVGELPEDVSDFSRLVTDTFPGGFYDTKYLSSFGAIAGAPDAIMDSAFSRFVSLEDLHKLMNGTSIVRYRTPSCLAAIKDALLLADAEQKGNLAPPQDASAAPAPTAAGPGFGRGRRGRRSGINRKLIEVTIDWTNYLNSTLLPPPTLPASEKNENGDSDTVASTSDVMDAAVTVNEGASHDAGYDATMTGIVFLKLASRLVSVANSFAPNRISLTPDDAKRLPYELSRMVLDSASSEDSKKIALPSWFLWEPIPEDILAASVVLENTNGGNGTAPASATSNGSSATTANAVVDTPSTTLATTTYGNTTARNSTTNETTATNGNTEAELEQLTYDNSFPVLSPLDTKCALETALTFFREKSDHVNRYNLSEEEIKTYSAALPLIQIMNRVAVSPFSDYIGPTFLLGCLDVQAAAAIAKSNRGRNAQIRKEHLETDILNPLLLSRSMQQRKNWIYLTNIYPAMSNQDILKILGEALDIRLTSTSCIYRQMQTNAFIILPSEYHVHLLVSEWMYARFGRSLEEKYEEECDDLLPTDAASTSADAKSSSGTTGFIKKWFKKVDDAMASISYFLSGRDNGDNMLGLSGWRKRPVSESFDSKDDAKRRAGDESNVVVYSSGRKVFVPPGLPESSFDVEMMRARTGLMDPLSVSLDDALLLAARKQSLGSFVIMPYQQWLDSNKDVFNGTCDHENK